MARSITLATIKRRARELADEETPSATNSRVDDTELLGMINASLGIWHGEIAKAVPERYEAEATITANGSLTGYDLPADYYQTIGVDYQLTSNTRAGLKRLMVAERNAYETSTAAEAEAYRIKGNKVYLYPPPTSGTYYHVYVTAAPVLASDSDTIDGVNGWEEWVVYDVAIKMMLKEESDATQLIIERDKIWAKIEAAAAEREAVQSSRVVDTRCGRWTTAGRGDPDFWSGR